MLAGRGVLTPTVLPFSACSVVTPAALAPTSHAAAMRAADDLHIETGFERLQPAVDHPDRRIGLAGRDRFEQLVGRAL